jgi:hypothetical protein
MFKTKVQNNTIFNKDKKSIVFATLGGTGSSGARSSSPAGKGEKFKCLCRKKLHFWKPQDCSTLKFACTGENEESRRKPTNKECSYILKEIYASHNKGLRLDLVDNHK